MGRFDKGAKGDRRAAGWQKIGMRSVAQVAFEGPFGTISVKAICLCVLRFANEWYAERNTTLALVHSCISNLFEGRKLERGSVKSRARPVSTHRGQETSSHAGEPGIVRCTTPPPTGVSEKQTQDGEAGAVKMLDQGGRPHPNSALRPKGRHSANP